MRLVHASATIEAGPNGVDALRIIERAARTCYKSECKGDPEPFVAKLLHQLHHESVIEHVAWTVRFVVDRGVSHELVRHRLAAFSQESTRYVDQGKKGDWTFVVPSWLEAALPAHDGPVVKVRDELMNTPAEVWLQSMTDAALTYRELRQAGWTPEQARSVLPHSVKTEVIMTANAREWRHVLKLRTSAAAHPDMRHVMRPLLAALKARVPVLYDDNAPDCPAS